MTSSPSKKPMSAEEAWIQFLAEHPTRGGIAESLLFKAGWDAAYLSSQGAAPDIFKCAKCKRLQPQSEVCQFCGGVLYNVSEEAEGATQLCSCSCHKEPERCEQCCDGGATEQWVSVETPPKPWVTVLVSNPKWESSWPGHWNGKEWFGHYIEDAKFLHDALRPEEISQPTVWQPLPAPPKETP